MGKENNYDGVDEFAVRLIRRKARRLVGQAGFREADRQDLEQELVLDIIERLPRFDPRLSKRETFITRLIENKIATLIESRKAGGRDYRKEAGSLDERTLGDDGGPVDEPPLLRTKGAVNRAIAGARLEEERRNLRTDIERVLSGLPVGGRVDLQFLCKRLQSVSVSEIARETAVPRTTLYEDIQRLRDRFERAGLAVYLERADRSRAVPVGKDKKSAPLRANLGDQGGAGEDDDT